MKHQPQSGHLADAEPIVKPTQNGSVFVLEEESENQKW
jgi:hypothetical protein